jgi:serine/threonine-protein kinase
MDDLRLLRETLAPRYVLSEEIGRGGMATVYRARDVKHERDVAVKVLDPSLGSAIGLERFEREIAIAAALQHANIVPLYDSGGSGVCSTSSCRWSAECCRQRMGAETQLPCLTRSRSCDVAAATHAHQCRRHRDIKPENILLSGGKGDGHRLRDRAAVTSAGNQALTELGVALARRPT